jgi:hypothetical protein
MDATFAEILAAKRRQRSSKTLMKGSEPFAMRALRDRLTSRDNITVDIYASGNSLNLASWSDFIGIKRDASELASFIVWHPLPARYRIQLWRSVMFSSPPSITAELNKALLYAKNDSNMEDLTEAYKILRMDIHRTPWIVGDSEFNSLTCVLTAFAMRHPGIGY